MNIIDIKLKSKTNPNVFVVQTEEDSYNFHSDIIVKHSIKVGEINSEDFFKAYKESETLIAFNLSTKYLSGKLKTEKQMRDYLYKKDFKTNTIEEVILKLKEYRLIDDKNFAETYTRTNKNFSANKLKQKLYTAGLKGDDVETALEGINDLESCKVNANKFLKNKTLNKETIEKLIRRLTYMGYRWDTIKSVLNNLKIELEDF